MVLSIEERIQGFLFRPSATFDASKGDTLGDSITYLVVILAIFAAIFGTFISIYIGTLLSVIMPLIPQIPGISARMLPFIGAIGPLVAILLFVLFFVSVLIGGIISAFIGGLWTHIWVFLVGGRKGVAQTIKAIMYGATPNLLLAFMPWAVIVQVIGIRELQELSTGRAILAVILAIIIPVILFVALFTAFVPSMLGPFPGQPFPLPTGPGFGGY